MIDRVIWIVLDGVGIGELPDAKEYGDQGSNTLCNTAKQVGGLNLKNLVSLGLGNIDDMKHIDKVDNPAGSFGKLAAISKGKDTTIGHWEMIGIPTYNGFPTYPNGFPEEVIDKFLNRIGKSKALGNCTASGTQIIEELGEEHLKTAYPIVYTSADSVFQIACHEDLIPIEKLYEYCEIAREILVGEHGVARVIARPFKGELGSFYRTENRRDFSLKPSNDNLLVKMVEKGLTTLGIGKIEDIFAGVGISKSLHTKSNMDGLEKTLQAMESEDANLIFTNLVEFDSKWGHRNDYAGFAQGLEEFDLKLEEILNKMNSNDMLIITADHGCDPTTPSTDHSREYVPVIVYGNNIKANINLGTGDTFANMGQTIAEIFQLDELVIGESFLGEIL